MIPRRSPDGRPGCSGRGSTGAPEPLPQRLRRAFGSAADEAATADRGDEAAPVAPTDATDGLLEWYFHDADAEIVLMERALKRYEAATVAASAGRLADASLAVGATLVTPIAAELETRARAHDLSVAAHLLASLERALMATKAASSDPLDAIFAVGEPALPPYAAANEQVDLRDTEWDAPALGTSQPSPLPGPPVEPNGPSAVTRRSGRTSVPPAATLWLAGAIGGLCVLVARALSPGSVNGSASAVALVLFSLIIARLGRSVAENTRITRELEASREPSDAGESHHRLLFERNPQPLWVYDRATRAIVAVSDAAIANYGYSRAEYLAMTIDDLVPAADRASPMDDLGTAGDRQRLEPSSPRRCRHQHKAGTVVDVEVTSDDLVLAGRDCRIVLAQDVTDRNKAAAELVAARDQAVAASNMKSAFLATVSHEIRTPMNGVIGMNELLLETELGDDQRAFAEQVARSGQQLLEVINDILDVATIEAGRIELNVADFDLRATISKACAVAEAEASAKRLRLDRWIAHEVPQLVRGDSQRLQTVVANLVSNAVKFTTAGSVSVGVTASPSPKQPGTRIRVEIADTGVGIDALSMERMFEPFTQADGSPTRNHGGTGLGLAIVRGLIDLMGGTIGAHGDPGGGTTFWFELDLATPIANDTQPAHGRPTSAGASRLGSAAPLVLVAEDSPLNQIVAVRALERCGCRTEVVGDGRAALQALSTQRYDAVLMDCHMPTIDGYQATALLRQRESRGERTPVIAMTAGAMGADRERCRAAGMDDYLIKPMQHDALTRALRRWIPALADTAAGAQGSAHA